MHFCLPPKKRKERAYDQTSGLFFWRQTNPIILSLSLSCLLHFLPSFPFVPISGRLESAAKSCFFFFTLALSFILSSLLLLARVIAISRLPPPTYLSFLFSWPISSLSPWMSRRSSRHPRYAAKVCVAVVIATTVWLIGLRAPKSQGLCQLFSLNLFFWGAEIL